MPPYKQGSRFYATRHRQPVYQGEDRLSSENDNARCFAAPGVAGFLQRKSQA